MFRVWPWLVEQRATEVIVWTHQSPLGKEIDKLNTFQYITMHIDIFIMVFVSNNVECNCYEFNVSKKIESTKDYSAILFSCSDTFYLFR